MPFPPGRHGAKSCVMDRRPAVEREVPGRRRRVAASAGSEAALAAQARRHRAGVRRPRFCFQLGDKYLHTRLG